MEHVYKCMYVLAWKVRKTSQAWWKFFVTQKVFGRYCKNVTWNGNFQGFLTLKKVEAPWKISRQRKVYGNSGKYPDTLKRFLKFSELANKKVPTDFSQTINAHEVPNKTQSVRWGVGEAGGWVFFLAIFCTSKFASWEVLFFCLRLHVHVIVLKSCHICVTSLPRTHFKRFYSVIRLNN